MNYDKESTDPRHRGENSPKAPRRLRPEDLGDTDTGDDYLVPDKKPSSLRLRGEKPTPSQPPQPRKPSVSEEPPIGPNDSLDLPPDYETRTEPAAGKGYHATRTDMLALEEAATTADRDFNRKLNAMDVLHQMGFKGDSIYEDEGIVRIFCPVHHDQVRRSMIIDPEKRTYRCTLKTCPANRGGALIELYAMVKDVSVTEARRRLAGQSREIASPEFSLVEEAQELIGKERYDEALPLLQHAVELSPKNETTRCRLAALQLEMGLRDEGMNNYLIAAEDYGVRGELEKTLQIYNLLVLMSPNDYDIHEQMAYIAVRLGNVDEGLSKLKWITNGLIEQDRFDEALLRTNRMLELAPSNTDILLLKADLLVAAGHADTAAQHIALSVQQRVADGALPAAFRLAQKGLQIDPDNELLRLLFDEVDRELRSLGLDPAMEVVTEGAEEDEDEEGFLDWIAELESEIHEQAESAQPIAAPRKTAEMDLGDARITMCKENLKGATNEEMMRMYAHLRSMYSEVKRAHQDGTLSDFEKKVIKDFYKAFCLAFKEYNRDVSGDSMLTRF